MPSLYLAALLGGVGVSHHEAPSRETAVFEAERQLPQVRGFNEFMGVPDQAITRLLSILPPAFLATDVETIDFFPKEIPDVHGRVSSREEAAPSPRKPAHPGIIGGDNEISTFQEVRTSRIRISAGSLIGVDGPQDLSALTRLPPHLGRPVLMLPQRVLSSLIHELTHALPEKDVDYYQWRLMRGPRCRFPYTERFVTEAQSGSMDWRGMAKEYRSEFARVLLTEVTLGEGERFEDAAVRYLLQAYALGDRMAEGPIRADVRHFMRSVAPDGYPWEQRIPKIQRGIRQISAVFHLNRFRRMYVDRVSDGGLRSSLDALAMMPADRVPPLRRDIIKATDQRSEERSTGLYDDAIIRAVRRSAKELHSEHDSHVLLRALRSWTLLSQEAASFNSAWHMGEPPDGVMDTASVNVLSSFEADWASLRPSEREFLRPHLLHITRACNGEKVS